MHIRFRFAKLGKVRFTSQRDVARMWERALRRARVPVAYTEGFSPRPRLSFGLALPTGCESEAEYLDAVLDRAGDDMRPDELPERLTPLFPEGVVVREAARLDPGRGSLQQLVTSCSWTVEVGGPTGVELDELAARFVASPSVVVATERKGRPVQEDVRPGVLALATAGPGTEAAPGTDPTVRFEVELATQPRGIRPLELVAGLAAVGEGRTTVAPVFVRACRTHQWIERDGVRTEPLQWARVEDAERAGYAWERAS